MRVMLLTHVLATTHEVSLKGGNRRWFERHLVQNVRRALADLRVAAIRRPAWRVLIEFAQPVPFHEVARRLGTVFGLRTILPVEHAGFTVQEVKEFLEPRLGDLRPGSFALRCQRSDKSFPQTSLEIEREVGGFVQDHTGRTVNLSHPDVTVHLLLDENGFWAWIDGIPGPGGLPVGTGGRAACLLSGGIDSPVAALMLMKRGMRLDFVHFHSVPRTDPASLEKVEELASVLARYQGSARLAMVPLLPIQEAVVAECPPALRVLLYRRFMMRLAARCARRWRSKALVTGESLGQVASQTIENMAAVETASPFPLLRPLIGLDKEEIIDRARRFGTYDISILPHFDCCSFLVPKHPETKAQPDQLEAAESVLDVDALLADALRNTEILKVNEPAPWKLIPPPPGVEVRS